MAALQPAENDPRRGQHASFSLYRLSPTNPGRRRETVWRARFLGRGATEVEGEVGEA